ncbi:MAG: acyl carrier protein [Clostridiales bacterium]|nr:acyl carrier protein [Clostridiales bacterium]
MLDIIKKILAEQFNKNENEINLETDFYKDLLADSLDIFQVISELEEEFDIEIDSNEIDKIKTVSDVLEFIKNKTKENK